MLTHWLYSVEYDPRPSSDGQPVTLTAVCGFQTAPGTFRFSELPKLIDCPQCSALGSEGNGTRTWPQRVALKVRKATKKKAKR